MSRRLRLPLAVLGGLVLTLSACDSGSGIDPDGPLGEAVANIGQWTFLDVEGSTCRDGSDTGIGVRLQPGADDLMIYLEGGGACFNGATCNGNPPNFDEADFDARVAGASTGGAFSLNSGIFRVGGDNPVGDWNMVYVPYCTGDVHGGSAPNAPVGGPSDPFGLGPQQFVGHGNVERMLALLADGLGDRPGQVLLTGASAGGFGTLLNFPAVAETFRGSELTLLDDSGPIFFQNNVLSPELAGGLVNQYNFPGTLPAATELFQPDGLQNIYGYLDRAYPDATFGLASHLEDGTIRFFFGFGQPGDPQTNISGDAFAAGLRDVRTKVPDGWATYFASGEAHTFIGGPAFYQASAGVALNDWLADLLDGEAPDVDPAVPAAVAAR